MSNACIYVCECHIFTIHGKMSVGKTCDYCGFSLNREYFPPTHGLIDQ